MAAVSFLLTPLLYSPLQAQAPSTGRVIIRDTVVISSGSAVTPVSGRMSLSGTDTFYVAPRPGALALVPYRAYKYGAALPNDSYLEIRLSDTTYTPQLLPYLPCVWSGSVSRYNCGNPIQTTKYDYEWCGEEPADTFYTRRLQTGDTVWFAFQGEFYNPAYAIAEGHVDTFLAAFMETATPPGCSQPHQPDEFCEVDFFLSDTTVTIVDHSPHEIWPYLPNQNNGASRGADRPGYSPTRGFLIKVLDPLGQPVNSANVRIRSDFVPLSGGHDHNDPVLPADRSGLFFSSGSASNPRTLTTDSTGTAYVDSFRASQIAGVFVITAHLLSDSTKKDTVNLDIRVPDLFDFSSIQTNFWNLTGNTGTTSYPDCPGTTIRHPSNHYCSQAMADALQVVLIRFLQWGGTQDGGGSFLKLDLNDMSLERGGVFDICNTWNLNRGHSFHRIGASVDIENRRRDFQTGQILGALKIHPDSSRFNEWGVQLERIMNQWGGRRYPEGPIHFGFGGGN